MWFQKCPKSVHNLVLGCLVDLAENPKTLAHITAWQGEPIPIDVTNIKKKTRGGGSGSALNISVTVSGAGAAGDEQADGDSLMTSAPHLLCSMWRDEEKALGVPRQAETSAMSGNTCCACADFKTETEGQDVLRDMTPTTDSPMTETDSNRIRQTGKYSSKTKAKGSPKPKGSPTPKGSFTPKSLTTPNRTPKPRRAPEQTSVSPNDKDSTVTDDNPCCFLHLAEGIFNIYILSVI